MVQTGYKIGPISINKITNSLNEDRYAAFVGSVQISEDANNPAHAARKLRDIADRLDTEARIHQYKRVAI